MQRAVFSRVLYACLFSACGLAMTLTPTASAQNCGRSGYEGYNGVYRTYPNHRLSRHRSGYLYRPLRYERYRPAVRIYDGYSYSGGGSGGGAAIPDGRADFDYRRDRLLNAATRIDVSFVDSATTYDWYNDSRPRSRPTTGKGWTFLGEGQGVRALGRFTARLLSAPTDGEALVGFALAASMIGDDEAAMRSMRNALRLDPAAVLALSENEELSPHIRTAVTRFETLAQADDAGNAQLMTAALHCLLGENDSARAALGKLDPQRVDERAVAVLVKIAGPPPAPPVDETRPEVPYDTPQITRLPAVAVR